MSVVDVAYYALLAGFCVATWRRTQRWHDAWYFAFALLCIDVVRAIVDPSPTLFGRLSLALGTALWLWVSIHYWNKSGIPCRRGGHRWVTVMTNDSKVLILGEAANASVFTDIVPHVLGQHWAQDVIIARVCARCGCDQPKENT